MMSRNSSSSLIRPDGCPLVYDDGAPVLDLNDHLGTIERGDITIWKTWLRRPKTGEGADYVPCLVLTPTRMTGRLQDCIPCVVTQTDAWVYDERHGDDLEAMIRAGLFCGSLGLNPLSQRDVFRVIGIIRDLLHELIILPPRPSLRSAAVADLILTNPEGEIVREAEVVDERV